MPDLQELLDFVTMQRDEYAELLEAEKLDRLQTSQSMYAEQLRLAAEIDKLVNAHAEINSKYLELVAMISYYTEDNHGLPYCRDIRGEVAKAAREALAEIQTVKE